MELVEFGIMIGMNDFGKPIDVSKLKDNAFLITGGALCLGVGIAAKCAEHG